MKMFYSPSLCLAMILYLVDSSSQSERSPDDGPHAGFYQCSPSSSTSHSGNCHDTPHSPSTAHHSARSSTPAELRLRDRSRSPTLEKTFASILGFSFEDLEFIRLVPHSNPNRVFELKRYFFPPDKPIGLRAKNHGLYPMPTGEQIVLSTYDGDVCAIFTKKPNRSTSIRPIFTRPSRLLVRAKINMNSGEVKALTSEEKKDCPVTSQELITKSYGVLQFRNPGSHNREPSSSSPDRRFPDPSHSLVNPQSSATSPTLAELRLRDWSDSPTLRKTFPRVLGYSFEQLPFIRLAPLTNLNRVFEFRRYIFSPDEPLRLRTGTRVLIPMPTGEQIVLSTLDGDVYAILEKTPNRHTNIRAIYTPVFGMAERAKINMNSGVVEEMNAEEIAGCPVCSKVPITKIYKVFPVSDIPSASS